MRMLTDSDRLAVYQGPGAVLFDAYLFRLQVDAGQLDPRELIDRLQSRWFQYVVLSADVSGVYHDYFFYRLPAAGGRGREGQLSAAIARGGPVRLRSARAAG